MMRAASALEARNDESQQLLDWSAHFLGHLLRGGAILTLASVAANALRHVRVDMSRQVGDCLSTTPACELSKGDDKRDSPPHCASAVALVGQPAHVPFDLTADP
jgi:hypothetical protein